MPVQWEKKMLSGKSYLELLKKKNCEELRFFPSWRDMAQIRLFRWQWKWYFQLHCVRGWWKLHHVTSRHCPLIANIRCESWPLHKTRLQRPWFWALRNEDHRTGALVRPWVQRYAPTEDWPEKESSAQSLFSSLVTSCDYPMITQKESFASSTHFIWGRPRDRHRGRWKDAGPPGPLKDQSCAGGRFDILLSLWDLERQGGFHKLKAFVAWDIVVAIVI